MSGPLGRWRGRWRVALRYGRRDARRNKGRTALVATMVALPVALGSFATTTLWSAQDTPESVVQRELGTDLQASLTLSTPGLDQTPDGSSWGGGDDDGSGVAPRPTADVEGDLQAALPEGDRLVRRSFAGLTVKGTDLQADVGAQQTDLADPDVAAAYPLAEGRLPRDGEVALSSADADQLDVAVGDTVELEWSARARDDRPLGSALVSGLLDSGRTPGTDLLYPSSGPLELPDELDPDGDPDVYPRWFVAGDTPVTWDDVAAFNAVGAVVVSRDVLLDPPPDEAVPYYGGMPAESASDQIQQWAPFAAVAVVALLEVVLLIGPAFAVGARRSQRSLAVVAAAGGTRRSLRAVVLATGVVIGVVASTLGVVVGLTAAAVVVVTTTTAEVAFLWQPVIAIFAVGVLLATGAAWLPARRASRADVVAVLAGRRGETSYRRWPAVLGTVLAAAGFAGAVVAGMAGQALLVAAGVLVGELGLVLACGGIIATLGQLARFLPLAWRFALRDAARNRGRTAPALAAVLVAVAGASGGLVYSYSQSAFDLRSQSVGAAPGVLSIAGPDLETTGFSPEQVRRIGEVTRRTLPDVGELHPVTVLAESDGPAITGVRVDPPGDVGESAGMSFTVGDIVGPVVDDGTLVDLLAVPEPDVARDALARGNAVAMAGDLRDDGTLQLTAVTWDSGSTDAPPNERAVSVPATGVGDALGPTHNALPLIPPRLVDDIGVGTVTGGLLAEPEAPLNGAQQATLQAALDDEFGVDQEALCTVCVNVGQGTQDYGAPQWLSTLLIVGSAGILALAAAWIAAALAATESRPDLATLAAVGAAPTTRKRIVAAQAGTIAVIGSVVGGLSGIALGAAFVMFERFRWAQPDPRWTVEIPWPVLGGLVVVLPLLAVGAAWLVTRSRLVLTRRLAD